MIDTPILFNGMVIQPVNYNRYYVYDRSDTALPNGKYFETLRDAYQYVVDSTQKGK